MYNLSQFPPSGILEQSAEWLRPQVPHGVTVKTLALLEGQMGPEGACSFQRGSCPQLASWCWPLAGGTGGGTCPRWPPSEQATPKDGARAQLFLGPPLEGHTCSPATPLSEDHIQREGLGALSRGACQRRCWCVGTLAAPVKLCPPVLFSVSSEHATLQGRLEVLICLPRAESGISLSHCRPPITSSSACHATGAQQASGGD